MEKSVINHFVKSRITLLQNMTKFVPKDTLKPLYRARLGVFEGRFDFNAKPRAKMKNWCPQCLSDYIKSPPTVLIKPPKKLKRKETKILDKTELKKPEIKFKKYLMRHNKQKLVSHCKSCGLVLSKNTEKPKIKVYETAISSPVPSMVTKVKKKRKRDLCFGLDSEAVLSAMKQDKGGTNNKCKKESRMKISQSCITKREKKVKKSIRKNNLKKISTALGVGMATSKSTGLKDFLSAINK